MIAGAPVNSPPRWGEVVDRVRSGNEDGVEELYAAVSECARGQLFQSVEPHSVEDHVHEIMLVVIEAIRDGELRDPQCLMGFVRTVTRRRISLHIRAAVVRRKRLVSIETSEARAPMHESPEARLALRQKVVGMRTALQRLGSRDREILIRFYYLEEEAEEICKEMKLTATQFRLFKSRAIAKCGEWARKGSPRVPRVH